MEQEISTNLTITDLKVMSQLIEACSARGVFKANELTVVGEIYNKITNCLSNVNKEESEKTSLVS
jgi:hypothetical protein